MRDQVLITVESALIEGEKKYSPPRDCTKSTIRVVSLFGSVGSRPCTKRACPSNLAPIIGSNPGPGDGVTFPGKNLESDVKDRYMGNREILFETLTQRCQPNSVGGNGSHLQSEIDKRLNKLC